MARHVVVVSSFEALSDGHGGNHRTYQIVNDLTECVGAGQVTVISFEAWRASLGDAPKSKKAHSAVLQSPSFWARLKFMLKYRIPYLRVTHPVDLLQNEWSLPAKLSHPEFVAYYRQRIKALPRPLGCVIENAAFTAGLCPVNQEQGVPMVACPQNLESWDRHLPFSPGDLRTRYLAGLALVDEWRLLAQCKVILPISRIEYGVLAGLGATCRLYPYRPVGEVRRYWEAIREKRAQAAPEKGLLVMAGSCSHSTTRISFERFLERLAGAGGLPENSRLVVVGRGTERLPTSPVLAQRMELRGRISDRYYRELMVKAHAVPILQDLGFGAVTLLSELACGGVPVLVSRFSSCAVDAIPGVEWVDDEGDAWRRAIDKVGEGLVRRADGAEYEAWELRQPRPLAGVVAGLVP